MMVSHDDLTYNYDGKMDEIHTLRNQYAADQVSLITTDTNACGIGWLMSSSDTVSSMAPYAFTVVHDDSKYACLSNQTLAHELGHNQGDNHNREDSVGSVGAYDYSYGYRLCQTGGFPYGDVLCLLRRDSCQLLFESQCRVVERCGDRYGYGK